MEIKEAQICHWIFHLLRRLPNIMEIKEAANYLSQLL